MCSADTPGALHTTLIDLAKQYGDSIAVPKVSIAHVMKAISTCKKSVSKADIERINRFTQQFGQEG